MQKSSKYQNIAFWSWNGRIEKDEAISQLVDFKEKGYGGAFIHARGGLQIPYMGEEWFYIYDACVDWAKGNVFDIWIYDEFGWPSGFAGGKVNGLGEEYQLKRLVFSKERIVDKNHRLLREFHIKQMPLFVYYVIDSNYVDIMDEKVVDAFIESTHEVYYKRYNTYFGKVIKGIFTDEPQIAVYYPWSLLLEDEFKKVYHVSLSDNLWRLYVDNDEKQEWLYKYYSIIATLVEKNFTKKLADWCASHNVLFTGHFAEEDGMVGQYRASGGVMRNYRHMQQPGIDFLGRRLCSPVLLKQISSVKNQYGLDCAISETFGCSGWNTSFEQLLWIWGYQASFGLNRACLHLSAYTIKGTRKRDYPAFFSYQEPWWDCFGVLSQEMEKISAFVSNGKVQNDIVVLSPLNSFYALEYDCETAKYLSAQYRLIVENLINKQYPFDIGDEYILADKCRVSNSCLAIGEMRYKVIIIPELISLREDTYRIVKQFKENGGIVVCVNNRPSKVDFKTLTQEQESFLNTIPVIANRAGLIEKYLRYVQYAREVKFIDRFDGKIAGDVSIYHSINEQEERIFLQNISTVDEKQGMLCVWKEGAFYVDGFIQESEVSAGQSKIKINLAPMQSLQIVFKKGEKPKERGYCRKSFESLLVKDLIIHDKNAMNIDKARYEIGGVQSELMDTVILQDSINDYVKKLGTGKQKVRVKYTYYQDAILSHLQVAVETEGANKIFFNNVDITDKFSGYYIDKCIQVANVTEYQRIGENIVVCEYDVMPERSYAETLDGFETERNLFHYSSEAESIYIVGDFSVRKSENGFTIGEATKVLPYKDLTEQGLYFYRGTVSYLGKISQQLSERTFIRFTGFHAPTAIISTGKGEQVVLRPSARTEITHLLKEGDNEITITLYSSNRNLLGPFHHQSGEPAFVGNNTFRGTKGFEDSILYRHFGERTYIEEYNFVPFGVEDIIIEKEESILE